MPGLLSSIADILNPYDLQRATEEEQKGKDPFDFLIREGLITKKSMLIELSRQQRIPFVELSNYRADERTLALITEDIARRFTALPIFQIEESLYVAMADPKDLTVLDYLRQLTGLTAEPVLATKTDIDSAINRHYLTKEHTARQMDTYAEKSQEKKEEIREELRIEDEEAPAIKLVNYMLSQAINLGASDVHIEPFPDKILLRYRIDGVLHEFPPPPQHIFKAIVSRIKIISGLDVAEKRLPQDGRSQFKSDNRSFDLRISIIPNLHGEGIVIRILDTHGKKKDIEDLGFSRSMIEHFRKIIRKPYGIFLVTGPTGSGKTTTLYAALKHLYTPKKKIITLEDPVEYQLSGITQIQVKPEIEFTFARGLRSVLRHDPDVLMLGEIRDLETAEIAIRSSLTGHMVLSTLHTNDAPSAITRLVDMGVPSYLVLASMNGVLAQRLIRVLCEECKEKYVPTHAELSQIGIKALPDSAQIYKPVGCPACGNLGYKGRIAVFELLDIAPDMRKLQPSQVSAEKIKEISKKHNYVTLSQSILEKFYNGVTGMEEVLNYQVMEQ